MATTTSLKLPESLKISIAQIAAAQGKTAHALMVETLQTAMDDAALRHQFYADGDEAFQRAITSNRVYEGNSVKDYIAARAKGRTLNRPQSVPLDASKAIAKPAAKTARKPTAKKSALKLA